MLEWAERNLQFRSRFVKNQYSNFCEKTMEIKWNYKFRLVIFDILLKSKNLPKNNLRKVSAILR